MWHKPHQIGSTTIGRRKVTLSMGAPIPCIHHPYVLIMNLDPTSSEKIIKVSFHCGQRCHFALQYPDRCQRQTPPDKKCYNCEEKGHFANACPNPHSRPPLPPSIKTAPNHKIGSTLVKVTMSWLNYEQVGHFANRCPDLRQRSTPTQGNQNVAWTLVYKKCYNSQLAAIPPKAPSNRRTRLCNSVAPGDQADEQSSDSYFW
jgi:hypothetical protein